MLPLIVALADLAASGSAHPTPLLTVTQATTAAIRWAEAPSEDQIAAMPATRILGGARAALECVADGEGVIRDCTIIDAQPDRVEVRQSAIRLTPRYRLDTAATTRAAGSATPATVWLVIHFPDLHGDVPDSCEPAFGCAVDGLTVALPPPPSVPVGR